jgi:hypothetical protein
VGCGLKLFIFYKDGQFLKKILKKSTIIIVNLTVENLATQLVLHLLLIWLDLLQVLDKLLVLILIFYE